MAIRSMGTVLRFTPGGGTQVTVGRISSIGKVEPTSEEIDITTLDSTGGYREKLQGVRDAGSVELTGYLSAGDTGQAALRSAYASGTPGAVKIVFTDGAEISFSAFVKQYSIGAAEVGGAVGFSAVLRITGGVTYEEDDDR